MRTMVAFDLDDEHLAALRTAEGTGRVQLWYGRQWPVGWRRRERRLGPRGLVVWDHPDTASLWPAWQADSSRATATLHAPLGHEQLIGEVPLFRAPLLLGQRLVLDPATILDLAAPFAMAHLDEEALTVMVDALGLGRVFEVRGPYGWAWSNRPLAACLFSGAPVRPSETGWRYLAGCDWTMGDTTPYEGVRLFGPGERVTADVLGRRGGHVDWLHASAEPPEHALSPETVERAAASLLATARTVARLWPDRRPVLHLSGGRDSRLTAAAFVAAGVDVRLRTEGHVRGEVDTARALVAALPYEPEHEIYLPRRAAFEPGGESAIGRVLRWHKRCEGLRSSVHMHGDPPPFVERRLPPVSGSAGEITHGVYYPHDVAQVETRTPDRRRDAWVVSLMARLLLPRGVSAPARDAVEERIRDVLDDAAQRGLTKASALDYFYVTERMRRWGAVVERADKVVPLLTSDFVRAALASSTEQRAANTLHRDLVARLVPAWAGIPFFTAPLVRQVHGSPPRLRQYDDVDTVTSVIREVSSASWGADFDAQVVQRLWYLALSRGQVGPRDEQLLQRVLWRALFEDHCVAARGEPARSYAPAQAESEGTPLDLLRIPRALAVKASDVPAVRRLARTPMGSALRRRLGV